VVVFLGLTVPLLAYVYITSQPLYMSTATISIEPSPLEGVVSRNVDIKDRIAKYPVLLKSHSLSEGVINALPKESFEELLANAQYTDYTLILSNMARGWLGRPPRMLSPQQQAISELQNARMEFVQPPQTPAIINIAGTASSPRVAMDLVNTYIQLLLSRTRNADQEEARKTRELLEQQVQQVKGSLTQAEGAVTKFEQTRGQIKLSAQTEIDFVRLSQAENALAEAQASREILTGRIKALRQILDQRGGKEAAANQGKEEDQNPVGSWGADNLAIFSAFKVAQDNLARLEAKLAALREHYTDAHPLVQITQEEVTKEQARVAKMARELPAASSATGPQAPPELQAALSDRTEAQRQLLALVTEEGTLQAKEASLKIQVDRLRNNLRNLSQDELSFNDLRKTVEANRDLLTVLSDKLMTARIGEQVDMSVVSIIDPASFPSVPTDSKTARTALLILAMTAAIAFGAAFGIESWRQPIETESDVQKMTGLPVLGYVGVLGPPPSGPNGLEKPRPSYLPIHLPSTPLPSGIHMELYRAIRATIETERLKSPFRTILISSPGPNEGKSTTILNLAHVFHEFGRRVLVIDADLRRPLLHRTLAVSNKPGLVDFLRGTATFGQVCQHIPSGFTVIPGQVAREDPAGLLASPRFKELVNLAETEFDLILVDSAPLLAVPDNILLGAALERVILVVRASKTSKGELQKAQSVLEQANAKILGVILNQANPADVSYYRPRYRKYYKTADSEAPPETVPRPGPSSQLGRH